MTTAEALDLYSKSETSRYELARMVLAGHRLRREVLTLQAEVARLTALVETAFHDDWDDGASGNTPSTAWLAFTAAQEPRR